MTDRADIEALAGEFVLGTLDAAERVAVDARRQREPELEAAIGAWERRLAPLVDTVASVEPPADLFGTITARIDGEGATSNIVRLAASRNRWRIGALTASALAACLAIAVSVLEFAPPVAPQNYVAVFQKDGASPAFVLSVDLVSRTLSVRRVAADLPAGKTFQLWIAADTLGPGMHSLGLVEGGNAGVQKAIANLDPATVQNATFGVSLEPAGGSPTGQPTGPAFIAKLIPTAP